MIIVCSISTRSSCSYSLLLLVSETRLNCLICARIPLVRPIWNAHIIFPSCETIYVSPAKVCIVTALLYCMHSPFSCPTFATNIVNIGSLVPQLLVSHINSNLLETVLFHNGRKWDKCSFLFSCSHFIWSVTTMMNGWDEYDLVLIGITNNDY